MSVLDRLLNPVGKEITLPSNGVFSGPNSVTVRGFITKDDKDLLLIDPEFPMGQLRQVVKNLVIDPDDFVLDNLVDADIVAILTAARIMTYGDEVDLELVCGHCDATEAKVFSLNDIEVTYLKEAPQGMKLKLKKSKIEIIYHILTVAEQKVIEHNTKNTAKMIGTGNKLEDIRAAYAAGMIDMVSEKGEVINLTPLDKKAIVENMPKQDALKWAKDREKYDCGHKFSTTVTCPACEEESEHVFVIGYDFFYTPMSQVLTSSIQIF